MPLVLVPTPLGNLRDITLRAVDELRDCDLVVAEDTRVTLRLLSALGIAGKPIWSYREQNAASATESILARAAEGRICLVTDAGTPCISDPGRDLVAAARAAGIAVEALPGPVAFVCAAVLSGFDLTGMTFDGFVPRTASKRRERFAAALGSGRTSLWYDAPGRIVETLATLAELAPDARVFVAREMTKRFEQHVFGTPAEAASQLGDDVRGEICLALEARTPETAAPPPSDVRLAAIDAGLAAGESPTALAKRLARAGFGARSELYNAIALRPGRTDGRQP